MITVAWGAATSAGRVRTHNEDDYVAAPPVFVVADGLGGHAAGEVASAIAVEEFRRLTGPDRLHPTDVLDAVERANDRILLRGEQDARRSGLGTTVSALVGVDAGGVDHWLVVNVGDSRVYRLAGGELTQLSVDHSEVQELLVAGRISAAEAREHPRRNVITRSLGSDPAPRPDQWLLPPSLGERFLLCSDGLVDELDDEVIASHLRSAAPVQDVADALITAAVGAGGRDNVTVVVVDVLDVLVDNAADDDTVPRSGVR